MNVNTSCVLYVMITREESRTIVESDGQKRKAYRGRPAQSVTVGYNSVSGGIGLPLTECNRSRD
ncbi:10787_t:CDS:2 [Funneliformis mosseae]|uniref:10787_t:CDS:1 n=1 Tax=Funneliformis mosseae TaxID=27381 RepID=A0A9N8YYJ1_FUNMO|nr:10787_t:CDS:2 [Funneliformis mosseae]